LMASYNEKTKEAERFVEAAGLPLLRKKDGTVVGIFPVDRVAWTQRFANKEKAISEAIRKMPGVKGKQLLVVGTMDQTARKALEAKGWKVEERFGEKRLREMVAKAMSK
jgi:hypothetical protein